MQLCCEWRLHQQDQQGSGRHRVAAHKAAKGVEMAAGMYLHGGW